MKNNERDTGGTPAAQRGNGAQEQQQQQEQQDTDPKHTPTPEANLAPTALHARHGHGIRFLQPPIMERPTQRVQRETRVVTHRVKFQLE